MSTKTSYAPFWPLVSAVLFGSFLATLCTTGLNIALPELMSRYDLPLQSVQWALTITLLAVGTVSPVAGFMGQRFGLKRVYIGAMAFFTLISTLCAFAPNLLILVLLRALQGAAVGLIIPTTMTLIYQTLPSHQHAMGLSIWSTGSYLAPAIAPTLSGWLLARWGLPSVFLFNLPVGLLGLLVTLLFVPADEGRPAKIDLPGFATALLTGLALLVAFTEGSAWGWTSGRLLVLFAVGLLALVLFIWLERRTRQPLLNIKVFEAGQYRLSVAVNAVLTMGLYGGTLLAPIYLQQVRGLTSLQTGLWLLPATLWTVLLTPFVGKLYNRLGPRTLVLFGLTLLLIGNLMLSFLTTQTSLYFFVAGMAIRYVGVTFATMPVTNTGMIAVPRSMAGDASAMNNWIRQGSASLAVGLAASLVASLTAGGVSTGLAKPVALTGAVNTLYLGTGLLTLVVMAGALFLKATPARPVTVADLD